MLENFSFFLLMTPFFGKKGGEFVLIASSLYATSHVLLPPSFCAALSPNTGHQPQDSGQQVYFIHFWREFFVSYFLSYIFHSLKSYHKETTDWQRYWCFKWEFGLKIGWNCMHFVCCNASFLMCVLFCTLLRVVVLINVIYIPLVITPSSSLHPFVI